MYISEKRFNDTGFLVVLKFNCKNGTISISRQDRKVSIGGQLTIEDVEEAIKMFKKETDVNYFIEEPTVETIEEVKEEVTENTEELI